MPREKFAQIENKNALLELLEDFKPFERIYIANNAYKDSKTKEIVKIAQEQGVLIEKVSRRYITSRSKTSSHESIIGLMHIDNMVDLEDLLFDIEDKQEEPFFLVFSDIKYPQNIAAIFRTAFAAGVNGIITPVKRYALLSDEVIRISMGTCLRIPIAEMNLFAALKTLQSHGIETMTLDMDGDESVFDAKLIGPKAFVLGSEDRGPSSKLKERTDKTLSLPMKPGLGSLNVSVSSAIVMYEKFRQEVTFKKLKEAGKI